MAGVNYEVNIALKTDKLEGQLSKLEERINKLKKNVEGPLKSEQQITSSTATATEKLNTLRQQSTQSTKNTLDILQRQTQELQKQQQLQKQSGNKTLQNVALGAGFPLLFGGGPGAILGGAAGGLVGGTGAFAAQIALSAIGQQLDKFVGSTAQLGRALSPLTADVNALTKASGLAGTETEKLITNLEEAGDATAALDAATRQMTFIVGSDGVKALKDFGNETQLLANQWDILMTQMSAGLAGLLQGPVAYFVKAIEATAALNIAKTSTDPTLQGLTKQLGQQGTPFILGPGSVIDNQKRLEIEDAIVARVRELRELEDQRLRSLQGADVVQQRTVQALEAQLASTTAGRDVLNEQVYAQQKNAIWAEYRKNLASLIKKEEDSIENIYAIQLQRQISLAQLDNQRKEAAATRAKREQEEAERAAKKQQEEVRRYNTALEQAKLVERLAILDSQIVTEKLLGNEATATAIEQEKVLTELASNIAQIKLKDLSTSQKELEILTARLNANIKLEAASGKRQLKQKDLDDSFAKTLQGLDFELEKVNAVTDKEKDMLKLKELELQYKEKGKILNEVEKQAALGKIEDIRKANEALAEQTFVQEQLNTLVNAAGQQFAGLFETLITGTNDWNSALRNVLSSLGSALFRYGLSALGGSDGVGLFSILAGSFTGGKRAQGGPVLSGTPYLVGEKGPELFMPKAGGNIIPNSAIGGSANVVVNVDAGGSNVQGDGNQAKALGAAIGAAVQAEIIKQKKPGGLLY